MAKVHLDPITRIEGHLSIEIDVQKGKVVDAKSKGDMFRGFETILKGPNPGRCQPNYPANMRGMPGITRDSFKQVP